MIFTIVSGGFLLLITVSVLSSPDRVISWPGVVFALLFFSSVMTVTWRSARAGVHLGPRGVLLYHAVRRAEVVPWDQVVRFEARPLVLSHVPNEGATIYLVGPQGELHETPIKRSVGASWDKAAYSWRLEVVLPEAWFSAAVDHLNEAVRPFAGHR
ncbi:hypothetical protein F4560_003705 [Saccharothrix ecbatanensis]|uniref:PH (Pleckstrin Homology) domain-containing protein n=1 Tax=Saccharothrix ecbatanensis TaxID=1105145 RepID=A0A7W9M1K8_9PSEU|nr:hypothetical protein [Saccharothrix ecbatanensis]MBB5803937.1 hypothetical protein [Saccharothrix ecbatanensis]